MWKVDTPKLLLIAAFVWGAAGINIALIGLQSYGPYWSVINVLLSAVVYVLFTLFVFLRLVRKHALRIFTYPEAKQYFWRFFDLRSFVIMAAMMTFGIVLRSSPLVPKAFIAVFYTGLGFSLITAGVAFGVAYTRSPHRSSA